MMTTPLQLTHPPRPGESDRDVRYTPAWCTDLLLEHCPPPRNQPVLDCCAGDGAILRVLADHGYRVDAVEIRGEEAEGLVELGPVLVGDWIRASSMVSAQAVLTAWPPSIVTNPPYSIGPAIMRACMETRPIYCAALLRLNHLGSAPWYRELWQQYPPTGLLILGSKRPSFSSDGHTDASEYVWVVWDDEEQWIEEQWIEVV